VKRFVFLLWFISAGGILPAQELTPVDVGYLLTRPHKPPAPSSMVYHNTLLFYHKFEDGINDHLWWEAGTVPVSLLFPRSETFAAWAGLHGSIPLLPHLWAGASLTYALLLPQRPAMFILSPAAGLTVAYPRFYFSAELRYDYVGIIYTAPFAGSVSAAVRLKKGHWLIGEYWEFPLEAWKIKSESILTYRFAGRRVAFDAGLVQLFRVRGSRGDVRLPYGGLPGLYFGIKWKLAG